jgi:predicted metal-binding membrane protein
MTADSLRDLERAHRAVALTATAAVTLAGWLLLIQESGTHARWALFLPNCHTPTGALSSLSVVVMWLAMSVAMMAPTTLNWLFAYARLTGGGSSGVFRAVSEFLTGYLGVWLIYSTAAAAIQVALQRAGSLGNTGKFPPAIAGLVLIAAGIVHFTPLRRACLQHCRNPMSYFLTHWHNGPRSGFRFGAAHATYCVGCCWALMLTGFAVGVMNLVWMALLTILICVEKLTPRGEQIAGVAAVGMILWGTALSAGIRL